MYRTAVATLRLTAPRRAFYVSSISAEKDLNHRAGDVLLKGERRDPSHSVGRRCLSLRTAGTVSDLLAMLRSSDDDPRI